MSIVTKDELKESLKQLYDIYTAECGTATLEEKVRLLTLIADTQAALLRMEEANNENEQSN